MPGKAASMPGPPPPPPPPLPPSSASAASVDSGGGGGEKGEDALFAAIRARKEKQEARMKQIEAGEISYEDPRESFQKKKAAQGGEKKGRRARKNAT